MIPKRIHYCWFGGGPKNSTINKCIDSWKTYCPDYEIIEWNEQNTDCSLPFIQFAITQKKWAFVADVVRLDVLINHGGIYLDTDMLLVKSLDHYLGTDMFIGVEEPHIISAGIIGSNAKSEFLQSVRKIYDCVDIQQGFAFSDFTLPKLFSETLRNKLKQDFYITQRIKIADIDIYPSKVFYPLPNNRKSDVLNYRDYLSEGTAAVHLWNASWVDYNEFDFIKQKKYFKAFKSILKQLYSGRVNYYYFVRLYRNFKKSL